MKKLYTIILLAFLGLSANAQVVYIPDTNFKMVLLADTLINTNKDTSIQVSEAAAFTGEIDIPPFSGVKDLTGIEAFTALTGLFCGQNNLTSLNLSSNTSLSYLDCDKNYLLSLDLSSDTALTYIDCTDNISLSSLNVSSLTALGNLYCGYNSITSLDISSLTSLNYLDCSGNNLTNLNVSSDTALAYLDCSQNSLTSLNASFNTALTTLYCYENNLTSLNVKNGNNHNMDSASFDATNNSLLTCIEVDSIAYSAAKWTFVDPWAHFSTYCPPPCSANFTLVADTTQLHHYIATNNAYGNGHLSYDWSWGDGSHDTIPYPSHVYADSGFYTICLTITDSTGCTSTYCDSSFHIMRTTNYLVYISVVPPIITGINSVSIAKTNFNIYPNPFSTKFMVESKGQWATTISIYNTLGEIVYSKKVVGSETIIDMNREPSGIYYIRITADNGSTINKKIVKQ